MADLKELLTTAARERWPTRTGLILALVVVGSTLLGLFASLDLSDIDTREWLIILVVLAGVCAFWFLTRLPRVGKRKVGFGIAIYFEDPDHANQIRADLLATMRDLVTGSHFRHDFEFVEFSQGVAELIARNPPEAERIARQANVHFLMWGRARLRTLAQGPSHVIDLRCLVRHNPIARDRSRAFSDEFSAVVPNRLILGLQGGMFACEFAARHLDVAARYVIGTAAALSNDFRYAEQLLLDAEVKIQPFVAQADGTPAAVLLDRVRTRIGELYQEWLARVARRHIATRDPSLILEQDQIVTKLRQYQPDCYGAHLAAAIAAFTLRKDLVTARREIQACSGSTDAAWRYGDAFLHAYEGDLDGAYRSYRRAFESPLEDQTVPTQCEEFIETVLGEDPDRYWLFFCLGLINYRAKGDLVAARLDFQQFIEIAEVARFPRQVEAVTRWMGEIDALLAQSAPNQTSTEDYM